ncbi:MAG: cytidylate kinase [Armatimonadetes bacterium RBG_16_58_9]|nr:MAG: cytidylate kinase [Armatimonadetes bacterium RBG_16_58_9]
MTRPIVAIDGPAGAGKSTVALRVAAKLGYVYIDTGAMYRAVAWKVIENKIAISEQAKITCLVKNLDIRFGIVDGQQHIFVDGEDLTEAVRTGQATRLSSPVSAIAGVRKRMVELQRKMGEDGGIVMEGRDIGTVVFPNAEVKVFLTASVAERARRRTRELEEKGVEADPEAIAAELKERDLRDSSRTHAPLKQAMDAVLLDTDGMSVEQVVDAVVAIHDEKVRT